MLTMNGTFISEWCFLSTYISKNKFIVYSKLKTTVVVQLILGKKRNVDFTNEKWINIDTRKYKIRYIPQLTVSSAFLN